MSRLPGLPPNAQQALQRALVGNGRGQVTLTASATTTTLTNGFIKPTRKVILVPTTANAAAEIGNGTLYVTGITDGQATINHASNVQTDRTFDFVVI